MSHGKRPAFQFYPKDWLTDSDLRACSPAARGVWADLLAIMHFAEPYGHLARDGKPMTDQAVARQVGESLASYRRLLRELEEHGVSSRSDDGILYSRRMVRDERARRLRALGGALSVEHPNVPRPKDDSEEGYPSGPPRMGERVSSEVSPSSPSSSSSSPPTATPATAALAELVNRLAGHPGRHDVIALIEAVPAGQSVFAWIRILIGCLDGDGIPGGVPATVPALARGAREFLALVANERWSPRFLRACVGDAMRTAISSSQPPARSRNGIQMGGSRTQRALEETVAWAERQKP